MDTRDKLIGSNLKRLIKVSNFSQKELAKIAKISETTISRAVNGVQGLQPNNLQALLDALGVTISDVLAPISDTMEPMAKPLVIDAISIAEYVKTLESENEQLKARLLKYEGNIEAESRDELEERANLLQQQRDALEKRIKAHDKITEYDNKHQKYRSTKAQDLLAEVERELEQSQSIKTK